MSNVITIRRLPEEPPLTEEEFLRLVREDTSFSGGRKGPIVWTDPTSGEQTTIDREPVFWIDSENGQQRYIDFVPESNELYTDDLRGEEESISRFLHKLRVIALQLNARVLLEDEEDITDTIPSVLPSKTRKHKSSKDMSDVVIIKRLPDKPPLVEEDFIRLVREYEGLSGGDEQTIVLGDVGSGFVNLIYIDPETGSLWTDDFLEYYEGAVELFKYHLRGIALALDARVFDEDGADITDIMPSSKPVSCDKTLLWSVLAILVLVALIVYAEELAVLLKT